VALSVATARPGIGGLYGSARDFLQCRLSREVPPIRNNLRLCAKAT
jgi:hypothetical protein